LAPNSFKIENNIININIIYTTMTDANIYYQDTQDIETIQRIVGGYFTVIPLADNKLMYVNEDGEIRKLPFNDNAADMIGCPIYGNVLISSI